MMTSQFTQILNELKLERSNIKRRGFVAKLDKQRLSKIYSLNQTKIIPKTRIKNNDEPAITTDKLPISRITSDKDNKLE